eukprot:scaffold29826_cov18-Tisochrysis_lutea.AAC.3
MRIRELADQVIDLYAYRGQLFDYLKSRMTAIAPNLTVSAYAACLFFVSSYGCLAFAGRLHGSALPTLPRNKGLRPSCPCYDRQRMLACFPDCLTFIGKKGGGAGAALTSQQHLGS